MAPAVPTHLNIQQRANNKLLLPWKNDFPFPVQVNLFAPAAPQGLKIPLNSVAVGPNQTLSIPFEIDSAFNVQPNKSIQIPLGFWVTTLIDHELIGNSASGIMPINGSISHTPLQIDFDSGIEFTLPVGTNDPDVPQNVMDTMVTVNPPSASILKLRVVNPGTETTLALSSIAGGLPEGISLRQDQGGFKITAAKSETEGSVTSISVPVVVLANVPAGKHTGFITPEITDLISKPPSPFVLTVTAEKVFKGWQLPRLDLNDSVYSEFANLVVCSDGTWRFLWRLFNDSSHVGDHFNFGWIFPNFRARIMELPNVRSRCRSRCGDRSSRQLQSSSRKCSSDKRSRRGLASGVRTTAAARGQCVEQRQSVQSV